MTGFTITGLDPAPFVELYGQPDAVLAARMAMTDGRDLPVLIERLFGDPATACLHAHNAKRVGKGA